jgi:hypothetical protein
MVSGQPVMPSFGASAAALDGRHGIVIKVLPKYATSRCLGRLTILLGLANKA